MSIFPCRPRRLDTRFCLLMTPVTTLLIRLPLTCAICRSLLNSLLLIRPCTILRLNQLTIPCNPRMTVTSPRPPTDHNKLSILLTNARSLSPKISYLIDFYNEMSVTAGIITESWFKDGPQLDQDLRDLELGTGLKTIYKNRGSKRQ